MTDTTFYLQQLAKYKAHLETRRNIIGKPFARSTLNHMEAGAEDFALFLLGLEPVCSERARGALVGERTKPLSRLRST